MPLTMYAEDPSVAGARAGDPLAWADLRQRFDPVLRRYLVAVDPEAAGDMDAVWARAARCLGGQPEGVDPLVWLLRVARDGRVICPDPEASDDPWVRAVRMLPAFEMDVVALRILGGLSDESTAFVIGRPPARVRAAALAGMARLLDLRRLTPP